MHGTTGLTAEDCVGVWFSPPCSEYRPQLNHESSQGLRCVCGAATYSKPEYANKKHRKNGEGDPWEDHRERFSERAEDSVTQAVVLSTRKAAGKVTKDSAGTAESRDTNQLSADR